VFQQKSNADGTIRYNARLVVKGYEQQASLGFDEIFAPVAKFVSVRVLLALAAVLDWEIMHLDVKMAFLYPWLSEDTYMELPEGYGIVGKVCQLKKSIYGSKQAPRAWYEDIDEYLCNDLGSVKSYILPSYQLYLVLPVYVDDMLIFCYDKARAEEVRDKLRKEYKMTDLGEARQFLGIRN